MKMFRLKNKAGVKIWYFAESESEAKSLAIADGRARSLMNLEVIATDRDYPWSSPTERATFLSAVDAAGAKGAGSKHIGTQRGWTIGDQFVGY